MATSPGDDVCINITCSVDDGGEAGCDVRQYERAGIPSTSSSLESEKSPRPHHCHHHRHQHKYLHRHSQPQFEIGEVDEDDDEDEESEQSCSGSLVGRREVRSYCSSTPPSPTQCRKARPMLTDLRKSAYAVPVGPAHHKVRSFVIKKGRLFKKGTRYVSHSTSTSSMQSTNSIDTDVSVVSTQNASKVLLLGASGVGKRALMHEFSGPDSAEIFTSMDDDTDRSVSILLDGQESTMEFVDMSDREVDAYVAADQIDAYVVVYSVEDRKSFETAVDRLYEIRQEESKHIALILVANKTDLVRTRVIAEQEGRSAAKTYDCKYIEVSAAIDHRIDELLVGILKQIRLIKERMNKLHKSKKRFGVHKSMVDSLDSCCLLRASRETVFSKLFGGGGEKVTSRSCDNLYVL